jgi:hypothetical protein
MKDKVNERERGKREERRGGERTPCSRIAEWWVVQTMDGPSEVIRKEGNVVIMDLEGRRAA